MHSYFRALKQMGVVLMRTTMPNKLVSRQNCHYQKDCYQNYLPSLGLWTLLGGREDADRAEVAAQLQTGDKDGGVARAHAEEDAGPAGLRGRKRQAPRGREELRARTASGFCEGPPQK